MTVCCHREIINNRMNKKSFMNKHLHISASVVQPSYLFLCCYRNANILQGELIQKIHQSILTNQKQAFSIRYNLL